MPRIDVTTVPARKGSGYPTPFDAPCSERTRQRLGDAGGLRDFGVNLMTLPPGGWSSQRHWHQGIDEIVVMLDGEAMLVDDGGETLLRAGDIATFAADVANGHHLVNRSTRNCTFVAIDNAQGEGDCHYPDVDLKWNMVEERYTKKDGSAL